MPAKQPPGRPRYQRASRQHPADPARAASIHCGPRAGQKDRSHRNPFRRARRAPSHSRAALRQSDKWSLREQIAPLRREALYFFPKKSWKAPATASTAPPIIVHMALSVGEPVNARLTLESNAPDMLNPQISRPMPATSMAMAIVRLFIGFSLWMEWRPMRADSAAAS